PAVLGTAHLEGEVTLHLSGGDLVQVETSGLREGPATARRPRPAPATAWRSFRYGHPAVGLSLLGQALAPGPAAEGAVGQARLTPARGADGGVRQRFSFRVGSWPQRTLPVRLPAGAVPVAAAVDGRWLERLVTANGPDGEDGEGPLLELPVPARAEPG